MSHLASGTCVLQPPGSHGLNEVEAFPGHDGSMAGCGHEGTEGEASLFHSGHLNEPHMKMIHLSTLA